MLLLTGPLDAAATSLERPPFDQRANLWWPDDRAWCVASEIDLTTTDVGGNEDCVRDLLDDPGLEVLPVPVDQGVAWDSDRLNPRPDNR